jgi:hypothetical protein
LRYLYGACTRRNPEAIDRQSGEPLQMRIFVDPGLTGFVQPPMSLDSVRVAVPGIEFTRGGAR